MNNKKNIKNIYFKSWNKSEEQINNELQTTGFIYKQLLNKFYIKVTSETYQDIYEVLEKINKYNGTDLYDSEIDYTLSQEEISKQLNINVDEQKIQEEDVLNKFDNLEIENIDKIEKEDKEFCEEEQLQYNVAITILNNFISNFEKVSGINLFDSGKHRVESKNKYFDWYKFDKVAELTNETKKKFINNIIWYFEKKYNITINNESVIKKYDFSITYDNILDEILIQLDGYSFKEKALKEIKEKMRSLIENRSYNKLTVKNNKVIITNFYCLDSWDVKYGTCKISYNYRDNFDILFTALSHFEQNATKNTYSGMMQKVNEYKNDDLFKEHTLLCIKAESIKLFKNGKIEIKFLSNGQAQQFAKEYCGYLEEAA